MQIRTAKKGNTMEEEVNEEWMRVATNPITLEGNEALDRAEQYLSTYFANAIYSGEPKANGILLEAAKEELGNANMLDGGGDVKRLTQLTDFLHKLEKREEIVVRGMFQNDQQPYSASFN
ncbi:hypothetical protein ACFL1B_02650 [Nanoarchaeota archaeon]